MKTTRLLARRRPSSARIARRGVGRTFQITGTWASMRVIENVQTALLAHRRRGLSLRGFATRLYRAEAQALLETVGLAEVAERPAAILAYGDQILTYQAHPEFSGGFVDDLIKTRGRGVVPDADLDAAQRDLHAPLDTARVAAHLVQTLTGGGTA